MIDTKAPPLQAAAFAPSIAVAAGTARRFNLLAVVVTTIAALLPLAVACYWLLAPQSDVVALMGFDPDILGELDALRRGLAAGISLAAIAPLSWGLLRLRVCFTAFASGRPFAAQGIAGLRDFSIGIGLAALAKPICGTLLTLLLSWTASAGRQFAIQIDSDMLIMVLFAATIASLAWALEKAAALAEENSQFV